MAESTLDSTEYLHALKEISKIIRERIGSIESSQLKYEDRVAIQDAITNLSYMIDRSISVDVLPKNYQPPQPLQRFIFTLPQSQSEEETDSSSNSPSSGEGDRPEFHSLVLRLIADPESPVSFTLLQLFEFLRSCPRFTPNESLPRGSGEKPETCNICLQRYFKPRNQPDTEGGAMITENTEAYHSTDLEPDELPGTDMAEYPIQVPCGHIFGHICIQRWILGNESGNQPTCPHCRRVWEINQEGAMLQLVVNL
ncbi:hypothetical protein MMC31_006528 [Peltigera leucophlebia]|nr:hypothetical protein [Peltigera leucophlebia]